MALLKLFTLTGGVDVSSAYWMVNRPWYDTLSGVASYRMVIWKDQATREAFKAAATSYRAAVSTFLASKAQLDGMPEEEWTDELRAQHKANDLAVKAAADAVNGLQPIGERPENTIDWTRSADVITDNKIDMAKLYDWIKANDVTSSQDA